MKGITQTGKGSFESILCDEAEPYGSEKVTYDGSDDHADKAGIDGLRQLSITSPAMTAITINPMIYPPVRTCQFGRTAM